MQPRTPEDRKLLELIRALSLPSSYADRIERVEQPIAARIAVERARLGRPMLVGVAGAQGGGKSTLAAFVAALLQADGLSTAVLSLDDLYLTRAERSARARDIHPLLATRGPPGTHDPALGRQVIDALLRPGPPHPVALPRFDKALDDRAPRADWPVVPAPVDVVLFEGWCVGAEPQAGDSLDPPLNALEREQDPDGRWRAYVEAQLAGPYRELFDRIDCLIFLEAPSYEHVFAWRALQERKLAEVLAREGAAGRAMDRAELATFVMHYERLTRRMLAEQPARADICVKLGPEHEALEVAMRLATHGG